MHSLKVLSALLCYPEQQVLEHQDEMKAILAQEAVFSSETRHSLGEFIDQLCARELMDSQADYVETFDRGRSLSLLLFEHVHGESRDRGQAMVDLLNIYKQNGFEVSADELPDYIPLYLEYLSLRPDAEALQWLAEVEHILALLATRLEDRENPYRVIFQALLSLLEGNVDIAGIRRAVAEETRDDSAEALDKVWEEEAVRFGGIDPMAGCGNDRATGHTHKIAVDAIGRNGKAH